MCFFLLPITLCPCSPHSYGGSISPHPSCRTCCAFSTSSPLLQCVQFCLVLPVIFRIALFSSLLPSVVNNSPFKLLRSLSRLPFSKRHSSYTYFSSLYNARPTLLFLGPLCPQNTNFQFNPKPFSRFGNLLVAPSGPTVLSHSPPSSVSSL